MRITVTEKGSDFVGLKITPDARCVTFPMGYSVISSDNADITPTLRSEILLLVRKISDCEKLQGERVCRINKNDLRHEFPIGSILFLTATRMEAQFVLRIIEDTSLAPRAVKAYSRHAEAASAAKPLCQYALLNR